jgi:hypothetical protein
MYIIEHKTRGVLLEQLSRETGKPSFSPTALRGSERTAKYDTLRYALLDAAMIPGAYVVRSPEAEGERWKANVNGNWVEV